MIPKHKCHIVQMNDSLETTLRMLEEQQIKGAPVLDGEQYIGIVTKKDIYEQYFKFAGNRDDFLQQTKAKEIVTHQKDVLHGDEVFEKTLVMLKNIPLLALVSEDNAFLGIVTRYDVLELFQSTFGMKKKGVRIACTCVESEGRIAKLSDIAHQYHQHIISFVTFDEDDQLIRRIVMKVKPTHNLKKFIQKLEEAGFRILHISEE
ncbi:MAG: CBS domain-containing protein [Bacillus sp. (in: firmicutes)]